MTDSWTTERGTTSDGIPGAADQPALAPEPAPVLAAAGIQVLTAKLFNRWTLAGTVALAALGVAAVLVRRWRAPSMARP